MAGPIITSIRNREALQRDLVLVATLCAILIPLSIALFFRRARAVLFVAAPAVLATVLAYAVAYLAFGYLTTVTSFLVSFVMGNGTNYAVVLLARYEEQRRHGEAVRPAVLQACSALWRTTGVAALASALSYASLMITSFRGFSQFGAIGAAGCLLAWAMTFTFMPALLCLLDRRGPRPASRRPQAEPAAGRWAASSSAGPRLVLGVGGALTLLLAVGAARMGRETFEYDFRKLSARGILDERGREFDQDHNDPVRPLAAAHHGAGRSGTGRRAAAGGHPPGRRRPCRLPQVIGDIMTVWDLLPGRPEVQQRKLALLADIRKATDDPALELLEDEGAREPAQACAPPKRCASSRRRICRRWPAAPSPRSTARWGGCCSSIRPSRG